MTAVQKETLCFTLIAHEELLPDAQRTGSVDVARCNCMMWVCGAAMGRVVPFTVHFRSLCGGHRNALVPRHGHLFFVVGLAIP